MTIKNMDKESTELVLKEDFMVLENDHGKVKFDVSSYRLVA